MFKFNECMIFPIRRDVHPTMTTMTTLHKSLAVMPWNFAQISHFWREGLNLGQKTEKQFVQQTRCYEGASVTRLGNLLDFG